MASSGSQAFFVRSGDGVKILNTNPALDEAPSTDEMSRSLFAGQAKVAAWSPDGMALALADPEQGVVVLELGEGSEVQDQDKQVKIIEGSSKTTMHLFWSPMASTLVSVSQQTSKTSTEPNLQVWRRSASGECESGGGTGEYLNAAQFLHPKLERDKKVLEWTLDETFCARLCPDGMVKITDGSDLAGDPHLELTFPHAAQNFAFAKNLRTRGPLRARLAVFVPDVRDDMQRVVGPGEVTILEILSTGKPSPQYSPSKRGVAQVSAGQHADLLWSPTASAILAHCTTEVDETGKSYYGGSKLVLISADGQYTKDLTDEVDQAGSSNGTVVQAVAWSPTRDEFILIQGFQPSQVLLFTWDEKSHNVSLVKVLVEKAHRNTVRFNSFGSLVCLAGFGNLAGDMDFFGRNTDDDKCDYVKVSSCTANCTVSSEWAPDGRHFLTAVLAPRMRVDNGFSIWRALTGTKNIDQNIEELLDTQWRPENPNSLRFLDVSPEEVERAGKSCAERATTEAASGNKKQAYRPPKARGEVQTNSVAAMMRGEAAMPAPEDRRRRYDNQNNAQQTSKPPWQPNKRDEDDKEKDPQSSPPLGPRSSPRDPASSPSMTASPPPESPSNEVPAMLPPSAPPNAPPKSPPVEPEAQQQRRRSVSKENAEVPPRSRPPPPPAPPPPGPAPQGSVPWAQEQGLQRSPPPAVAPVPPKAPPSEPPSAPAKAQAQGYPPSHPPQPKQVQSPPPSQPPKASQQQRQQQQAEMAQQRQQQQQQQQRQAHEQANEGIGKRGQVQPRNAPPTAQQAARQQQQATEAELAAMVQQYQQQQRLGPTPPFPSPYDRIAAAQLMQQQAATAAMLHGDFPGHGGNPAHTEALNNHIAAQHAAQMDTLQRQQQAQFLRQQQALQQQQQALAQHHERQAQELARQQQQQQQQRSQQAQQNAALAAVAGHHAGADKRGPPCPQAGWQYVDPKGNVQGPFTLLEMQLWNSMGYFRPDLPMRCDQNDSFLELQKMFPPGTEPFVSYPRRPNAGANGANAGKLGR